MVPSRSDASTSSPAGPKALTGRSVRSRTIDAQARTYNKTGKMPTNLGTRQYAGIISAASMTRVTIPDTIGKTTSDLCLLSTVQLAARRLELPVQLPVTPDHSQLHRRPATRPRAIHARSSTRMQTANGCDCRLWTG